METSMHSSFDHPDESDRVARRLYRRWGMGLFLLPVLMVVAMIGMVMTNEGASRWLSDAAQAEFVNTNLDAAPLQLAQPDPVIRAAKVN
jgi:hypothetical protein